VKDINNISQIDKNKIFQTYTDLINLYDEDSLKLLRKEFYKDLIHRDTLFMPFWLVLELEKIGYNPIPTNNEQ